MHGVLWAEKIIYPYGGLAQLVRAPASHAGGHWFESSSLHQKVSDFARNQKLFFLFTTKKFDLNFHFFSDQYTDQYGDSGGSTGRGIPARYCRDGYDLFVWSEKIQPSSSHASASALASFLIGKSGADCIMSTKCPQSTCRFRRVPFSSVEPSSK